MTFEQLIQEKPQTITIQEAAAIMGVTPRFLQLALQQNKFPFGIGVEMERWAYYINTERFIHYMKATDLKNVS
jgi:hypothetical protein